MSNSFPSEADVPFNNIFLINSVYLKAFAVVDRKTFYTLNHEIYVGKQLLGKYNIYNSAADIVLRIVVRIKKQSEILHKLTGSLAQILLRSF